MFGFGKKKEDSERDKKLKDLRLAYPSARRPYNDDSVIEILFQVQKEYNTLRIFIAGDFPNEKPVLQVVGPLCHPWLDQYKRIIGYPKLTAWTKASSLSELIRDCINGLQGGINATSGQGSNSDSRKISTISNSLPNPVTSNPNANSHSVGPVALAPLPRPPSGEVVYSVGVNADNRPIAAATGPTGPYHMAAYSAMSQPNGAPPPYGAATAGSSYYSAQPMHPSISSENLQGMRRGSGNSLALVSSSQAGYLNPPTESQKSPIRTPIPDIPNRFPELNNLSNEQLERLLTDEIAFKAHYYSNPSVVTMRNLRDDLRSKNLESAEKNLAQESQVISLYEEVSNLQSQLLRNSEKCNTLLEKVGRDFTKSREDVLREVLLYRDSIELESDNVAKALKVGEINLNAFLDSYLKKRTEYHSVCCKLDILQNHNH